ncbi:MAG: DUF4430 domain-containing protein [Cellulosilyticaceae bacterium]
MKGKLKTRIIIGCMIVLALIITWGMGKSPSSAELSSPTKELEMNPAPSVAEEETKMSTADSQALDEYQTAPVPEGKPEPVEPQDVKIDDSNRFEVTLSVSCGTILQNMALLDEAKHELVPEDGIIFSPQQVIAYEGESVFDVLLREMQKEKIHMEYVNTPMYNSAYIEGINNLYEFDTGELSGWMYKVNGWFPNYGCSRYQLEPNDVIEWVYTCDLGRDVGEPVE